MHSKVECFCKKIISVMFIVVNFCFMFYCQRVTGMEEIPGSDSQCQEITINSADENKDFPKLKYFLIGFRIVGGLWFADHSEAETVARLKVSDGERFEIKLKRRGWRGQVSLPTIFTQFPAELHFVFLNPTLSPRAVTLEQFAISEGENSEGIVDFCRFFGVYGNLRLKYEFYGTDKIAKLITEHGEEQTFTLESSDWCLEEVIALGVSIFMEKVT